MNVLGAKYAMADRGVSLLLYVAAAAAAAVLLLLCLVTAEVESIYVLQTVASNGNNYPVGGGLFTKK